MRNIAKLIEPGQRGIVTQQIPQRDTVWTTAIQGTVERVEQRKTGSWYAHSRDNKLWLDRLVIRKDDGEIVMCNLDPYTHVQVVEQPKHEAQPEVQEG